MSGTSLGHKFLLFSFCYSLSPHLLVWPLGEYCTSETWVINLIHLTKATCLPLDNCPPNVLPDEGWGVPAKFDVLIQSLNEPRQPNTSRSTFSTGWKMCGCLGGGVVAATKDKHIFSSNSLPFYKWVGLPFFTFPVLANPAGSLSGVRKRNGKSENEK